MEPAILYDYLASCHRPRLGGCLGVSSICHGLLFMEAKHFLYRVAALHRVVGHTVLTVCSTEGALWD